MAFSPIWTFLIIGILIIVVLIVVNVTPISKRINLQIKTTSQEFPVVKSIPNPWTVTNTTGSPLDPIVQNDCPQCSVCPNCQIYTFRSGAPIAVPVVPKIQNLPDCLSNGTCEKVGCASNGAYPTCVWPDQTSVFYGTHVCGASFGPIAGTGCITQNGGTVDKGTVETLYTTCPKSSVYPACASGVLDLIVLNWNVNGINPTPTAPENAFSQFFCMTATGALGSPIIEVEGCDISQSSQLWVIQEYSYNGVQLYQEKGGQFISIYHRGYSAFLKPVGYNPNNPRPVSAVTDLEFYSYGNNTPDNPGVWWLNYTSKFVFPSSGESAPPQIVFIPDYTRMPNPIFQDAYITYILGQYSIIPFKTWQDFPENFVNESEGVYTYQRNTIGPPIAGTTLQLKPFLLQRNISNPGLFYSLPLQFNTSLVDYTNYNDIVSQSLQSQNIFNST